MWFDSYSPAWRAYEVDPVTWKDGAEIGSVQTLDIASDAGSETLADGSMKIDGSHPRGYVRVYIEAVGEDMERVAVGTFECDSRKRTIDYSMETTDTSLLSLLTPASEKELPLGWFAPKGTDPARYAADIIRSAVRTPVESVRSDLRTERTIVAEGSETALSFARTILDGTGYRVTVSGDGTIRVTDERATHEVDASMVYDSITDDQTEGRVITMRMPFDPGIQTGDLLDLRLWGQGVYGLFEVETRRVGDDCEMEVTAVMADG